ncbi:MAG: hypothetical protein ABI632_13540 [Pseudolysinimonas sp.]
MLRTGTAFHYGDGAVAGVVPPVVEVAATPGVFAERRTQLTVDQAMDEALAESFPASDPPSWNPGIARPAAENSAAPAIDVSARDFRQAASPDAGEIELSGRTTDQQTYAQMLTSIAGISGIALLVPFVILLVGLPVALSVRGLVEAIGWLVALVSR